MATKEVSKELSASQKRDRIAVAESKRELLKAIKKIAESGPIEGRGKTYTYKELEKGINWAFETFEGRKGLTKQQLSEAFVIAKITNGKDSENGRELSLGIREKVIELILKRSEKSGQSGSVRSLVDRAALNFNIRRADRNERLAEENTDDSSRAKYYSRAASRRENAANLLGGTGSTQHTDANRSYDYQARNAMNDYIKAAEYWDRVDSPKNMMPLWLQSAWPKK